jgi:hypothetical protein
MLGIRIFGLFCFGLSCMTKSQTACMHSRHVRNFPICKVNKIRYWGTIYMFGGGRSFQLENKCNESKTQGEIKPRGLPCSSPSTLSSPSLDLPLRGSRVEKYGVSMVLLLLRSRNPCKGHPIPEKQKYLSQDTLKYCHLQRPFHQPTNPHLPLQKSLARAIIDHLRLPIRRSCPCTRIFRYSFVYPSKVPYPSPADSKVTLMGKIQRRVSGGKRRVPRFPEPPG